CARRIYYYGSSSYYYAMDYW
nr:immunoglobulin heavy chain junction region [Mus musculus]MBK4197243.1 immunoglobulin heavy chain junction region [Mus musculus]